MVSCHNNWGLKDGHQRLVTGRWIGKGKKKRGASMPESIHSISLSLATGGV